VVFTATCFNSYSRWCVCAGLRWGSFSGVGFCLRNDSLCEAVGVELAVALVQNTTGMTHIRSIKRVCCGHTFCRDCNFRVLTSIQYVWRAPYFESVCYLTLYLSSFLMVIYKYLNASTILLFLVTASDHVTWSCMYFYLILEAVPWDLIGASRKKGVNI